jgi:putative ABC transport system permease protein
MVKPAALLDVLGQDLKAAGRSLVKHRGFTLCAVLSLALGIGANTALFSLVDGLLLRTLAVREPQRLVTVQPMFVGLGIKKGIGGLPPAAFAAMRARREVFSHVVGYETLSRPVLAVDGADEPTRRVERVSATFFDDLGLSAGLGRMPRPGEEGVALVSDAWWRARFDGSDGVLGRIIAVDGDRYTIIGVAPRAFAGLWVDTRTDAWIPARPDASLRMLARLAPDVDVTRAQATAQVVLTQVNEIQPASRRWATGTSIAVEPAGRGFSDLRDQYERPLVALSALVVVVLLITCTNVGNLLVVRHAARRRELAVRVALGAGRWRLVSMYLAESVVLAIAGATLGLVLARWGVSILLSMLPVAATPDALAFRLDARAVLFVGAVSLLSALLFGLAPAWRAARGDMIAALRSSAGKGATAGGRRLDRWLVACQVALSVLLLVGAGLFVQTVHNLLRLDVGFDADGLLQVSLDTRGAGYGPGQVGPLQSRLLERVARVPGVRAVSAIRNGVMQAAGTRSRIPLPGRALSPDEAWNGAEVGPGFFETLAIPVRRGRTFTADDFAQNRRLVVVSDDWARRYFPGENPIGARIGEAGQHEIVGVVAASRIFDVRSDVGPTMYFMAPPEPDRFSALEVRAAGDVDAVARAVQAEIRQVDPRLVLGVRTMRQEIGRMVAREQLVAATSTGFSLVGLLLASVGIFGVAASTVARRTSDIGIRMALGASRWTVIREALRDTLLTFAAGLAGGIVAAVAAARLAAPFVGDLLFGLAPTDAATLAGAGLVMLLVAVAACVLPARRAVRIDPLAAIREP